MKNDWILDVLADLRTFALANGLEDLADQLDDTRMVAACEIVSMAEKVGTARHGDDAKTGNVIRGVRERARA
ncbi:hypothetical protein CLV88_101646 [Shimia abyssi]|uniref:Uncharacterized protein n=1 Tax=Shimia abyssi TaxID=1662395 RepID=A0A2P8FKH1_9RHOB|nr:hypothetical protein CLV88_101646 [Shimia abyssi]